MGYYKVPQNIEAEDTILGPLTLKQLIFLIIAGVLGFFGVLLAQVSAFFLIPIVPFFAGFLILGVYRPNDQPVENKLAAYLGFYIKPRTKVWSRDGIIDHVTIKAPKVKKQHLADDRSPEQVRSQLKQLAQVVDTRGWSTRQTDVRYPSQQAQPYDDRIVAAPMQTRPISDDQPDEKADVLDLDNNPLAQQVTELTNASAEKARADAIAQMKQPQERQMSNVQTSERQQTYPTQPNQGDGGLGAGYRTTIQPQQQAPQQPASTAQPVPTTTSGIPNSSSTPSYNPYPSHMHQRVLHPDGSLDDENGQTVRNSTPEPDTQTVNQQAAEPPQSLDDEDKQELQNLADAGLNIEALQRHGREMTNDKIDDNSGEIVISH